MIHRLTCAILSILLAASLGGCSGCSAEDGPSFDSSAETDAPPDGIDAIDTATDTNHETPDLNDDLVCAESDFEIRRETVRIMLLLDQSSSMIGAPWTEVTDALEAMLADPMLFSLHFGLDAFPDGYPGFWTDCGALCVRCMADSCGYEAPPQVPVGPHSTTAPLIIGHMNNPDYPQFCTSTPLVNQMEYYDTGAGPTESPDVYMDDGQNYLLVVSDGYDENCFSGDPVSALTTHTRSIRDTHGIRSFAIGYHDITSEMEAQLNAIASNGGTSYTSYIPATDGPALEAALTEIMGTVITCVYVLEDPGPIADHTNVNFYDGPDIIYMDPDCTETSGDGWHWLVEYTTVEFCGPTCEAIKSGEISSLRATWGCPTEII